MMTINLVGVSGLMREDHNFLSVTEAKSRLLQIIRDVSEAEGAIALTPPGAPAAFLLSPQRYYGLLEGIDLLSDEPPSTRSIARSNKPGKVIESILTTSSTRRWSPVRSKPFLATKCSTAFEAATAFDVRL